MQPACREGGTGQSLSAPWRCRHALCPALRHIHRRFTWYQLLAHALPSAASSSDKFVELLEVLAHALPSAASVSDITRRFTRRCALRLALLAALSAVIAAASAALLGAPSSRCCRLQKKKKDAPASGLPKATRACARVHLPVPLLSGY